MIITSIARQLSSLGPGKPVLKPTIMAYQSYEDGAFAAGALSLQDSYKLLLDILESYPTVTIIIDALDECQQGTRRKFLDCLERLMRNSPTLIKIFISSRDDHDIQYKLQNYPSLELSSALNSHDIAQFVRTETNSLVKQGILLQSSSRKDLLSQTIISIVSRMARGM